MSVGRELGLQKEAKVFRSGANLQLLTGERPFRQLRQQFASEDDSSTFILVFKNFEIWGIFFLQNKIKC